METAVEWLVDKLKSQGLLIGEIDNLVAVKQAKQMEKEQIINTYRDGRSDQQSEKPSRFYNRMAEQYYNETYEK
jgi:hypothetical protein